jgi:hypothetical protein
MARRDQKQKLKLIPFRVPVKRLEIVFGVVVLAYAIFLVAMTYSYNNIVANDLASCPADDGAIMDWFVRDSLALLFLGIVLLLLGGGPQSVFKCLGCHDEAFCFSDIFQGALGKLALLAAAAFVVGLNAQGNFVFMNAFNAFDEKEDHEIVQVSIYPNLIECYLQFIALCLTFNISGGAESFRMEFFRITLFHKTGIFQNGIFQKGILQNGIFQKESVRKYF